MSLFQLCPWWSSQCPDLGANYDAYSLHCCRLNLVNQEKDFIVVGSHTGYLSIYYPTARPGDEPTDDLEGDNFAGALNANAMSSPNDLVLEMKFPHPIIGITSGKFIGTLQDGQVQLALLHPMKVSVYAIKRVEGTAAHGNQTQLELCHEHKLRAFALSMSKGNFGGVKGKEFLCVAHINNTLSVFEQDGIVYESVLGKSSERSIPTMFCYVQRIDSFVTVSASFELECYRYQDLVQRSTDQGLTHRALPIEPTWSCCVGELALDIAALQKTNDESVIMILGENNLISMTDTGKVRFIKRLDYTPVCFTAFIIGWFWEPNARLVTAVVSERGSILIYEEAQLIWTLQLSGHESPVAVQRSNLQDLPGALIVLSETGLVNVGYLGSDPYPFQVPALNMHRMNAEAAHGELVELEKEIRTGLDFTDTTLMNAAAERDLQVKISRLPKLERVSIGKDSIGLGTIEALDLKKCMISVNLKAGVNIDQIQVFFDVAPPLMCTKATQVFRQVNAAHTERIDAWIFVERVGPISSLEVKVVVSFINTSSICRIIEKTVPLPLDMFFKPVLPVKEDASVKITMTLHGLSGPMPTLSSLLPSEFAIDSHIQAIGLQSIYAPDTIVTIVAAKSSNRIRLQSNDISGLPLIFASMRHHFNDKRPEQTRQPLAEIQISPHLPIGAVISTIGKCYRNREKLTEILLKLEARCTQMRLVQRRLLVKLDDKKSGTLDGVLLLFERTQSEIAAIMRELGAIKSELAISQNEVSCAIAMTKMLVSCLDVPLKSRKALESVLVSPITQCMEQSWEEMTSAAVEFLNQIGPIKHISQSSEFDDSSTVYVAATFEFDRFQRHLVSLLERICRMAGQEENGSNVIDTSSLAEEESEWINEVASATLEIK